MATNRLKHELLRGVVDENLETLAGEPTGTRRRERSRRRARRARLLTAAAVVLIVTAVTTVAAWMTTGNVPRSLVEGGGDGGSDGILAPLAEVDPGRASRLTGGALPRAVRRVAIDAGHGGVDSGTALTYGLLEKEITLDVATRLEGVLEARGFETVMTRRDDEEVSLRERAEIANAAGADLFLSIHVNWYPDRHARGVETYILGPTDDPQLAQKAASENSAPGFTLADSRRLLERMWAGVRHDESHRLASDIQETLFETLRDANPEVVSRGVLRAPFVVLVATEMPAVLAEVACLSNDREARLLALPRYRERIASGLAAGVARYAERAAEPRAELGSPRKEALDGEER